ncbi:hypothetical protein D3C72_1837070 [compost metagenome]
MLEGDPEALAQFLLAHAQHGAAKTDPAADMNVDRVRLLFILDHVAILTSVGNSTMTLSAGRTITWRCTRHS